MFELMELIKELERLSKDNKPVQIYISSDCTPHGELLDVQTDYIRLRQIGMAINPIILIPIRQIKYVRIIQK